MRAVKRSFSLLMVLLVVVGAMVVAPISTNAATISEERAWPGINMIKLNGYTDIYYAFVPKKYDRLIFNDGIMHDTHSYNTAYQTDDLYFPGKTMLYTTNGQIVPNQMGIPCYSGKWSRFLSPLAFLSNDRVVYFKRPSSWSGTPKCYFWTEGLSSSVPSKTLSSTTHELTPDQLTDEMLENISLGNSFSIELPEDVPILGKAKIELDMSYVPVQAKKEGNKLYLGIGCNDILKKGDEQTWCNYKKFFKEQNKNIKEGTKYLSDAYKKKAGSIKDKSKDGKKEKDNPFEVSVFGYYEATFDGNKVVARGGMIDVKISVKGIKGEKQLILGHIPIVIKYSLGASGEVKAGVSFDTNTGKAYFEGNLEFVLPNGRLSAGVGIAKIADLSVYGEFANTLTFRGDGIKGNLNGEAGVSFKFLFYEHSYSILKSEDGWTYLKTGYFKTHSGAPKKTNKKSINSVKFNEKDLKINRSYVKNQSGWLQKNAKKSSALTKAARTGSAVSTLQTSVYNNALPHIVSTNDTTMMVWLSDIPSRSTGNHIALVYSIYDENTGLWSEPAIVDDDGTADSYPSIAADDNDIYVAWSDENKTFDENAEVEDVLKASEISVAKFNKENGKFDSAQTLTENEEMDIRPQVGIKNGKPYVIWKSNTESSFFEFSGTDKIMYASEQDGSFVTEELKSSDKQVIEVVSDGSRLAYTVDEDSDPETTDDNEIYAGNLKGTYSRLTDNDYGEYDLAFSTINGSSVLTYTDGSTVYGSSDLGSTQALTAEDVSLANYKFVSSGNETRLISNVADENSSNVCVYTLDENGKWNNPVAITEADSYLRGVDATLKNGSLRLAYLKTVANIGDEEITETSDLCAQVFSSKSNLTLNTVDYDRDAVVPGSNLPLDIEVSNNGTDDISGLNVRITDELGQLVKQTDVNTSVAAGETKTFSYDFPVPASLDSLHEYKVYVTPHPGSDSYLDDNSTYFSVGYTNLQVYSQKVSTGSDQGLLVTVNNTSRIPTDAKLIIRDKDEEGSVLDEFYLESIAAGGSRQYLIDLNTILAYKAKTESICVQVEAFKDEENTADNTDLHYINDYVSSASGDVHTVYFLNTENWAQPRCYFWKTNASGPNQWPGVVMNKTSVKYGGCDVYSFTYNTSTYDKVIFNDGNYSQTADLDVQPDKCYRNDTEKWFDHNQSPEPEQTQEETKTVFFVNTDGFYNPYCYVWNDKEGTGETDWPGRAMTDTSVKYNGYPVYSYSYNPDKYDKVIFSDYGDKQTPDLNARAGKYYVYNTGKWCEFSGDEVLDSLIGKSVGPDSADPNFSMFGFMPGKVYSSLDLLGVQKKGDGTNSLRFVTAVSSELLSDKRVIDYGYIFTSTSKATLTAKQNAGNLTIENGKKYSCKGTYNTMTGSYGGEEVTDTPYKYVTAAVNNVDVNKAVVARFYIQTEGETYYASYTDSSGEAFKGCAARFSELTN